MNAAAPVFSIIKKAKPFGIVISALIGAALFISLFGAAVYDIEGLSVKVSLQPAREGKTVVEIPPLGNISADTHDLPMSFHITLNNIGVDLASSFLDTDSENDTLGNLKVDFPELIKPFLIRQIAIALMGALITIILLWRFNLKYIISGALVGTLAVSLLLYSLFDSYDIDAFAQPEINGVLSLAASVFPEPDQLFDKLNEVQSQTRLMVDNIELLFASINGLASIGSPEQENTTKKILLVGDLHSNPVGIELISSIADNFKIDLIIDTGDLTDFGSPLETQFAQQLTSIDLPYLFCPGNHDTPDIIDFVASLPQAQILQNNIIEVAGIKILGNPDPLSASDSVTEEDQEKLSVMQQNQIDTLKAHIGNQPDIVVVHNYKVAEKLDGFFPLIVTGHNHKQSISNSEESIILNPGTTGAAGLRGLYTQGEVPYSAIILYIRPDEKIVAVDIINYIPASQNFLIERKLLRSDH